MIFVCLFVSPVEIGDLKLAGPDVLGPRGLPLLPGRVVPRRLSPLQSCSGAGRGKHPPGDAGSRAPAARPEPLGGWSPALKGPGEDPGANTSAEGEPERGWSPRGAAVQSGPDLG